MSVNETMTVRSVPSPMAVLELFKPITWFPPVWAFGCGVVSAGVPADGRWIHIIAGLVLAGPLVCAMSQAANDWCDRHVDAINEPHRPIPSGRVPGRWGLYIALLWSCLSLAIAFALGTWVFWACVIGVASAWAYSAEPIRLKRSGWAGAAICALCYEGLPWFTGAAVLTAALPDFRILIVAALYSFGAIGIMILNDFKSVEGDQRMGVSSVPVMLGFDSAALVACVLMIVPQTLVVATLIGWGMSAHAGIVGLLILAQVALVPRFMDDPVARAPWYNATGTLLYVLGMLTSAFALNSLLGGL